MSRAATEILLRKISFAQALDISSPPGSAALRGVNWWVGSVMESISKPSHNLNPKFEPKESQMNLWEETSHVLWNGM